MVILWYLKKQFYKIKGRHKNFQKKIFKKNFQKNFQKKNFKKIHI